MARPFRIASKGFSLALGLLSLHCASSDAVDPTPSFDGPGGAGGFSPGNGAAAAGGGYGANGQGANSGNMGGSAGSAGSEPMPPMCEGSERRCEVAFSLADTGQNSVEVRGDFSPTGWEQGVAMAKSGGTWKAQVKLPWNKDVRYKFLVDGAMWIADPQNTKQEDDGFGGKNSIINGGTCEWWSCESNQIGTFDWRDSVIYFVFVDRFLDGDPSNNGSPIPGVGPIANFQGGDWKGVQQKLEEGYFTDLGINTLWLTVPMDNTDDVGKGSDGQNYSAYHGYWPKDLTKTEERFGTMAELKGLVDAAHAKNIKVILDYAMNHVHSSAPIYQQHPDWFWPLDHNGKNCVCGDGCDWNDPYESKRCWFTDYLPDFNFTNPQARAYSVDNAIMWVKDTGVDGYRLDAVKHIEDSWLLDLRAKLKTEVESQTQEHFYLVGETYTGDRDLLKYYVKPSMLDGQFDFPLRMEAASKMLMRQGSMNDLAGFMDSNDGYYGSGIMSTFIGNHDIPRVIHLAEDNPVWDNPWSDGKDKAWNNTPGLPNGMNAFERLANGFTLLLTIKGAPLIYYGDEIGLPGGGDPDNRRAMQWTGYSAGQQFLLQHIKKLTTFRAQHPATRRGQRKTLFSNNDVLVYEVSEGSDKVVVALNRADSSQTAQNIPAGNWHDYLGNASVNGGNLSLPPRSGAVLSQPLASR